MASMADISVRYVYDPGVKLQHTLMKITPESFYQQRTADGESLFEIVYSKLLTEPDLMAILQLLLPLWDNSMDDQDCAKWTELLCVKPLCFTSGDWDLFYNDNIKSKKNPFCTSGCSKYEQRLLWIQLVPMKDVVMNVAMGDLLTVGLRLNCMNVDALREIEKQCVVGCWQHKVFSRLVSHDLTHQSTMLKKFMLCFLTGKVSQSDMHAMWQDELGQLFTMLGHKTWKDRALQGMEAMVQRCTTSAKQSTSLVWTVFRYKTEQETEWETYPNEVSTQIEMDMSQGCTTSQPVMFIDGEEHTLRIDLQDPANITAQHGSSQMQVKMDTLAHPLGALKWTSVIREMDKTDEDTESWGALDFATVTNASTDPPLKALHDEIAAMLPDRDVHHTTLINNLEQALAFMERIRDIKEAGFKYKIMKALHGPSSWAVVDKIMVQGFRHSRRSNLSAEHPNLVEKSNGQYYGPGVYFDIAGSDQGGGCGYGIDVSGCFIGLSIHFWVDDGGGDVPTYKDFHVDRDPNVPVFRAGQDRGWCVVRDPSHTLMTAFVHHTSKGGQSCYEPDFITKRFAQSIEQRTMQITRNGPEVERHMGYDLQRLPEIAMAHCMVPRPSDINLLPGSMRPADGHVNTVLPVGPIGEAVRKSRVMCWESDNLNDVIPDQVPSKRLPGIAQLPPPKRIKSTGQPTVTPVTPTFTPTMSMQPPSHPTSPTSPSYRPTSPSYRPTSPSANTTQSRQTTIKKTISKANGKANKSTQRQTIKKKVTKAKTKSKASVKRKADLSTMTNAQITWYQQTFTSYRDWQRLILTGNRCKPPVRPKPFIWPSQPPTDLNLSVFSFPWDAANAHLLKRMAAYQQTLAASINQVPIVISDNDDQADSDNDSDSVMHMDDDGLQAVSEYSTDSGDSDFDPRD